jgi:imidazole glycerol-phosphate synthase subunit HisH
LAKIGIVDYGLGNLRSVAGAVERLGHEPVISTEPSALACADKLILPGVGAFGDGMRNLRERGLVEPLSELVIDGEKPVLAICLGAQLVGRRSEEFGDHEGLGWIDAEVVRLSPDDASLRVPHVGWNDLLRVADSILFADVPEDALFYYVHSYCIRVNEPSLVTGECDYGGRFVAALERGNIYATQFHPEKSQLGGLTLLRNFLAQA